MFGTHQMQNINLSSPINSASGYSATTGMGSGNDSSIYFSGEQILAHLANLILPCYVAQMGGRVGVTHQLSALTVGSEQGTDIRFLASVPPIPISQLGDPQFCGSHGVRCAYMAGAMAGGIASEELVIAMGQQGLLSAFGAGGLRLKRVEEALMQFKQALPDGPFAVNLIHNPGNPALELNTVKLLLKYQVKTIEASAFLDLTPSVVLYRAAGLSLNADHIPCIGNRIIAKVSRREVAAKFMAPAPLKLLQPLAQQGLITELQAQLAQQVPLADDITVEADSGGHTDNRPLVCLLPSMIALRNEMQTQYGYRHPVRIGAAGGISTPHAALAAFSAGAAYVVTGSINQACVEAGTSPQVKQRLGEADMADVIMAPAADMFEMGVKLQVLKRGTLFAMRAQKLWELYRAHNSLEEIPAAERVKLEQQVFRKSLDEVWQETAHYLSENNPDRLDKAEQSTKVKMASVFRWYLGLSSRWPKTGEAGREIDYQIWCGPAMGSFNNWCKGTYLEDVRNRKVVDIGLQIMTGAAFLYRVQILKLQGISLPLDYEQYIPLSPIVN